MKITQVYQIVNDAQKQILGEDSIVKEDLSNVVSIGESIANMNLYDKFVGALVNRIAKNIFSIRAYSGRAPKVLMDSWEFGSIVQKVHGKLPDAQENESWELQDNETYNQDTFYKPQISVKLWNHKTTFEIPLSIAEEQLKQSFLGASEMARFVEMLFQMVENSLTLKFDALIMRTINNFIGATIYDATSGSVVQNTTRCVKLLTEYNTIHGLTGGDALTQAKALYDKDFLRYVAYRMKQVASRMANYSTLFNIGGTEKHTPRDLLRIVLLDYVDAGVSAFLQSDTFHEELVKLPEADVVACWQGSGETFALADASKIHVEILDKTGTKREVEQAYIAGVMFDFESLGVTAFNKRVKTHVNERAEFYNYWYKEDAGYFNDYNENFVVFLVA
ncbi:hypothetical protein [Methanobrevibacter sp.]|uniref:hypothetical protein n=1 Tax=Methanobrevibacter sp. TaxID=66852 RepID=UPI00388E102D